MRSAPPTPLIVDVKRNSLDDGPGIRSVVFFKGCPLRCVWCQNPEALSPRAEIQRDPARCASCGACRAACPEGAARGGGEPESGKDCRVCGSCVDACPFAARRIAGRRYDVAELALLLACDEPFYRHSRGGVTFSGGEPALYPVYAGAVARSLRQRRIDVLLETSGHFRWDDVERHLLPHISTVYFDVKLADPGLHRRFTGRTNAKILDNLHRLVSGGFERLIPRVPLVPDITDSGENLEAIAALLCELGLRRAELLPYNPLWVAKRRALGMDLPYQRETFMRPEEIARCRDIFEAAGIRVIG